MCAFPKFTYPKKYLVSTYSEVFQFKFNMETITKSYKICFVNFLIEVSYT